MITALDANNDEKLIELAPLEGQHLNTVSTYKPCLSCFVTFQVWSTALTEEINQITSMKTTIGEDNLCLTNPGG